MEMDRMNASSMLEIGLRIEMCLERERFHTRRRMKVEMRMFRRRTRISLTTSDRLRDLVKISWSILL